MFDNNMTPKEALTRALWLGYTAETPDQEHRASELAGRLAHGLLPEEVAEAAEAAKRKAGI